MSDYQKDLAEYLSMTPEQRKELHKEAWPECSGFPQSCPENEGYGCCMGNKTRLCDANDLPEGREA